MGLFDYFKKDDDMTDDGVNVPDFPEQEGQPVGDPSIAEYIKKKYGLDEKFKRAQADAATDNKKIGMAEAFGTAFGGSNKDGGGFYNSLRGQNAQKVAQADAARGDLMKDFSAQRQMKDWAGADADKEDERDPNSQRSMLAKQMAAKFNVIPADKLEGMNAAQIKQYMPFMQNVFDMQYKKDMLAEQGKQRQQDRMIALGAKQAEKAEKKQQEMAEINVPGFTIGDKVKPQKVEAKDARDAASTFEGMQKNIDDLRDMVKKNGSFEAFGADSERMGNLSTDIRLQLKQLAKLGVLSKTDYDLLDKQLSDPTSLKNLFKRDSSYLAQIDQLSKLGARNFDEGMKAKGYIADPSMSGRLQQIAGRQQAQPGQAMAAPAMRPVHEMSEDEIDAELKALGK